MRAVVLGIAPEANVVDLSHDVAKYQVRDGALLLWCAAPYLPVGSHVAVVDPGVGTERRPIAVRVHRGDVLIGPDNGLLLPAAERLGGVVDARLLASTAHRLPVVSSSFHGRDIFAPAAAHLATGVPFAALGPELAIDGLVRLPWPAPEVGAATLAATVLYVDTFGNLKLGAEPSHLHAAFGELPWGTSLHRRSTRDPTGVACHGARPSDAWRLVSRCSTRTPTGVSAWRSTRATRHGCSTCTRTIGSPSPSRRPARNPVAFDRFGSRRPPDGLAPWLCAQRRQRRSTGSRILPGRLVPPSFVAPGERNDGRSGAPPSL